MSSSKELAKKLKDDLKDSEHVMHEWVCETCGGYGGNDINLEPIATGRYIPTDKRTETGKIIAELEADGKEG